MALDMTVKVHPTVLVQIVDSFERRNSEAKRIIGTLLGVRDKGVVEVTNCFIVPHSENDEVSIEMDFVNEMYDLHVKVNPTESMVGWFATGSEVTGYSALIHEYYSKKCSDPVHLTIDTLMENGRMGFKAYMRIPMGVPGGTAGTMFCPVPVKIATFDAEKIAINVSQKTKYSKQKVVEPQTDLSQIAETTHNLEQVIDTVASYVDDVLSGKVPPDAAVGRQLLDLVHAVPKMSREEFENMLNSNMKDLLMVVYLSQLTQTQLHLSEKLGMLKI